MPGPHVTEHGFVSGHAAVVTVLVCVLLPHVRPRLRGALVSLALLVALIRVYVGAHLPLDVVGGAALAVAVAAVVHLCLGRPEPGQRSRRASKPTVRPGRAATERTPSRTPGMNDARS